MQTINPVKVFIAQAKDLPKREGSLLPRFMNSLRAAGVTPGSYAYTAAAWKFVLDELDKIAPT